MKARIYPKADAKSQWWESLYPRGTFSIIEKILLHTTETTGWPGYKAGASAPTLTYHPKYRLWHQHNFINTSARALVDPSWTPVRENRDNVIQIEIICYSDERIGRSVGGVLVSQLTDDNLQDLADFINWTRDEWGGPPLIGADFIPYPESYGNSVVRMTSDEYNGFRGVLGHMNASGNAHGDPGGLNLDKIMALAAGAGIEEDMPLTDADVQRVVNGVLFHKVWPLAEGQDPKVVNSSFINNMGWQTAYSENILTQLAAIAKQVGAPVEVDEQAIAASVVASISNTLKQVVVETLAGVDGVDEQAIADKVVERIGSALAGPTT